MSFKFQKKKMVKKIEIKLSLLERRIKPIELSEQFLCTFKHYRLCFLAQLSIDSSRMTKVKVQYGKI